MSRSKAVSTSLNEIEVDFLEALRRLRRGTPCDNKLQEAKAAGRLKITFATVAREAKRSRSLVAHVNSPYPLVRELILLAKEMGSGDPGTPAELIDRLRREVSSLRADVKTAEAHTVEHFLARKKAERDAARWHGASKRWERRALNQCQAAAHRHTEGPHFDMALPASVDSTRQAVELVSGISGQIADATGDTPGKIAAMQSSTQQALVAIEAVGHIIGQVYEIAASIAATVEEHGSGTGKIARDV